MWVIKQWVIEKKQYEKDKQVLEQQKEQLKKSLDDRTREFDRLNEELLCFKICIRKTQKW